MRSGARRSARAAIRAVASLAALACAWLLLLAAPAAGETPITSFEIDLGAPPTTPAEAMQSEPTREDIGLRTAACGQELNFLENAIQNVPGEGVASLLAGKVAWLAHGAHPCTFQISLWDWTQTPAQFNARFLGEFGRDDCEAPIVKTEVRPATDLEKAEGAPGDQTIATFKLSAACLRHQINLVIGQMQPLGQIGTDNAPCRYGEDGNFDNSKGDWDVVVRDLVRVYYMVHRRELGAGQFILDRDVKAHLFNDLLTIDGPLQQDVYTLMGCGYSERSTGTPAERAAERGWAADNAQALTDGWDALRWPLLFALLALLLVGAAVATVAAGLPPWIGTPLVGAELGLALAAGAGVVVTLVASIARIPETENHLLMINTSRYLINQIIIEDDPVGVEAYVADQTAIKAWLLARTRRITAEDFREFNARPYQRYSVIALLNLHDFVECTPLARMPSRDCDLRDAADIVLDLAAAKYEAGSNEGRRSAPFRRLQEQVADDIADHKRLVQTEGGSDFMFPFMLAYAGHTDHLPDHKAQIATAEMLMYAAASDYHPSPAVMGLALSPKRFEQTIRHDGVEIYSATPSFLVSAGGVRTRAGDGFGLLAVAPFVGERCTDRGAALPTVLIPGGSGYRGDTVYRNDFLRIDGPYYWYGREAWCLAPNNDPKATPPPLEAEKAPKDRKWTWSHDGNACVHKGFACGVNLWVPQPWVDGDCFQPAPGRPNWWFLDSAACPALKQGPHIFVTLYKRPCPSAATACVRNWCFFEAVEAGTPGAPADFEAFKTQTLARNPDALIPDPPGGKTPPLKGVFVSAMNERIAFDAAATLNDKDRPGVVSVDGVATPSIPDWRRAVGPIMSAGCPGNAAVEARYEISGGGKGETIDFCDVTKPTRVLH